MKHIYIAVITIIMIGTCFAQEKTEEIMIG